MKEKILLIGNPEIVIIKSGGYGKQIHYLIQILKELNYDIYYLNYKSKLENNNPYNVAYTYEEMKEYYRLNENIHDNFYKSFYNELLKDVIFYSMQQTETEIKIQLLNNIIDQENIDKVFFLGDIFVFIYNDVNEKIKVPSFYWYPCHYYSFSSDDLKGLCYFQNIICLTPSIKLLL